MTRLGISDSPESTFNNTNNNTNNNLPAEGNTTNGATVQADVLFLLDELRTVLGGGINMARAVVPQAPPKSLQEKFFEHLLSLYFKLGGSYEKVNELVFDEEGEQLVFDFFACCGDRRSKKCVDPFIAEHIWNVLEGRQCPREKFIEIYNKQGSNKPSLSFVFGLGHDNAERVERVFNEMGNGECLC